MYYRTPSVRDQRFEGVLIDEIDRADGEQREAERTAYLFARALDAIAWQAWWRPEDLTT